MAKKISISLSVTTRMDQCFETRGGGVRKKGTGRPQNTICRDDHITCTIAIFQQDNASAHTAKKTKKWLENKHRFKRTQTFWIVPQKIHIRKTQQLYENPLYCSSI